MYEVTMPKLSDSMETGKVIAWRAKEGDAVREGDVLAEVESDKAVMELECFHDGTLSKILKGDGSEVAVGEVIAQIAPRGESVEAPAKAAEPSKPAATAKPKAPEAPKREPQAPKEERKARAPSPAAAGGVSPYARKVAEERGIDLSKVKGSGPGGRVIARDVEQAARPGGATPSPSATKPEVRPAAAEEPAQPVAPKPSPDEELPPVEVTPEEATIEQAPFRLRTMAMRVTASKHVIPHFYVTRSVDVTELMKRQDALKKDLGATLTHVVAFAALKALTIHPDVNRSYDRGRIIRWKGVHLGLAVATDDGLTVAVLRDAQDLGLKDLAERTTALVARAREGKLSGDERRHPTFTITNLGMFGVEQFEAIINPPSAITLAVAAALDAPVVRGDKVEVGKVMKLTISCDHRIVDGVAAAKFLADLARLLESPDELLAEG